MSSKAWNGYAVVLLVSQCALLGGCAVPMPYAPTTQLLAELDDAPLVSSELGDAKAPSRRSVLTLRGGRVLSVRPTTNQAGYIRDLPIPLYEPEKSREYVPPFKYRFQQAGDRHYLGFVITPEIAQATQLYLAGDAKGALNTLDGILADSGNQAPELLWHASDLRVNTLLILSGRPDLAEAELQRMEALETKVTGSNHLARALRAEVRLWSGDMPGALRDASQVVRAIGTWRMPTVYLTPVIDQLDLNRITIAQGRAQMVLGHVLAGNGDFKSALPWFELASQTTNDAMYVTRHPLMGATFAAPQTWFYGRGFTLAAHGMAVLGVDPSSAQASDLFRKAQDYFDAIGFKAGTLLIQLYKCNALYTAGQFQRLASEAQSGIDAAEKLGANEQLWIFHTFRGTAFLRLGERAHAEESLRAAQSILDLISGTSPTFGSGMRAAIGKEAITEGLISIGLQKQGGEAQLFEDAERGRARSFVALLATRTVAAGREAALVRDIRLLDEDIAKERAGKTAAVVRRAARPEREQELLRDRAQLVLELRRRDPDLADALSVSAVSLNAVQAALSPGQAMVYVLPATGVEPIRILLITKSGATVKTLPMTAERFAAFLDNFNAAVVDARVQDQRAALANLRRNLGVEEWGKPEAAYIVPSGRFHFVPWGALDLPFPVSVLPNGGWVVRASRVPPERVRAVVLGDPVFGGRLAQLPGARAEAVAVSGKYGIEALLGQDATEQALRNKVGAGVDVLHFATHALYDPVYPLQSSLILTNGKQAVPLTAEKLFQEPLAARLVVLSACETGMGRVIAGDDLLGLARSFYLAGASAVVSSLWPVDDEATRAFMEAFHERARGGQYGSAWLAARDVVKAKGYPPSSYGAFVLGGTLGARP